jgi:hypothetical protein
MDLNEIRERVENAPRLKVATTEENDFYPASVYEEEDGLNTLCYLPGEYSGAWQDMLAREIVAAYEDRARLMAALDALKDYGNDYIQRDLNEIISEAIENWKPREY